MLIASVKQSIRKEACWTLSNITAGTVPQITSVIEANIIPLLIHLMSTAEFEIKKEATWAISNATTSGSVETIKFLVSCGCLPPLCEILHSVDNRIILVALEGIENILSVGETDKQVGGPHAINSYSYILNECGGLDTIETLQGHLCDEIYEKAFKIIDRYFSSDLASTDQPTMDDLTNGHKARQKSGEQKEVDVKSKYPPSNIASVPDHFFVD
jgi:hypothetical protein